MDEVIKGHQPIMPQQLSRFRLHAPHWSAVKGMDSLVPASADRFDGALILDNAIAYKQQPARATQMVSCRCAKCRSADLLGLSWQMQCYCRASCELVITEHVPQQIIEEVVA